ncbi:MAG: saccharopine dehydrogenase NADP-binding domain-containing protein [Pseudomonadota bacterium]
MSSPKYSVIVFGATSFVGQILCHYLVDQFGSKLKWAAAGRSQAKLEALRADLGPSAAKLPLLIADADDEASLLAMCAHTQVLVSTVGPYALYGEPLIRVCVETGTDYCDLTGEVQWIRRMITRYEAQAKTSGARIVHCCGFDSLPSDLGVHFLQQQARARFGQPCTSVKMRVKAMAGTASGGTVASLINVIKEAVKDPALRRELADPYSICPSDHGYRTRQPNVTRGQFDADFNSWITPFVMAAINTRIVHRSNALSGNAYGANFKYGEAVMTHTGPKGWMMAQGMAVGIAGFMAAVAVPPLRRVIEKYVVPKPGEGPSPAAQARGFYDFRFIGTTEAGQTLRVKVTGDRDPGYGSTAKMLGQAAACLAQDIPHEERAGGFWTPATIFGDKLIKRLVADAGLTFTVLEAPDQA